MIPDPTNFLALATSILVDFFIFSDQVQLLDPKSGRTKPIFVGPVDHRPETHPSAQGSSKVVSSPPSVVLLCPGSWAGALGHFQTDHLPLETDFQ